MRFIPACLTPTHPPCYIELYSPYPCRKGADMLYNYVTDRTFTGSKPVTVESTNVDYIYKSSNGFGGQYCISLKEGGRVYVNKSDAEMVARSAGIKIDED